MTEEEAIAVLEEAFTGDSGFVARLRNGDGLDAIAVTNAQAALETLHVLWADRDHIPKEAARALVDVFTPIYESAPLYPEQQSLIEQLAQSLVEDVERVLYPVSPKMTEERAIGLVFGHLNGLPSLALRLHHLERLDDEWAGELLEAIDTLASVWSNRTLVPKVVVAPMLNVRELIRGHASLYPKQQAELEAIADDLAVHVKRCLDQRTDT
jgi:hypothetical protein